MADPSAAGAKAALDGYEYQLDVSVFAALRLMLAASATALLATHGPVEVVVRALEALANSSDRRALMLLGASELAHRDRAAAVGLLDLLDPAHPARRLLDLEDGEQLPPGVLDDLGHIRVRRAVRFWLGDAIAKD